MTTEVGEDASFIPADLAIQAMRDSGYKNTAYALAELIDNSVQAQAKTCEIICLEEFVQVSARRCCCGATSRGRTPPTRMRLSRLW